MNDFITSLMYIDIYLHFVHYSTKNSDPITKTNLPANDNYSSSKTL